MGILDDLRNKVQRVNDGLTGGELVRDVIVQHPTDILELQRYQLLEGKTGKGEDIRPYYSEDLKPGGRFHSVQTAGRYAAMKQDISYPYTVNRNPDAPNLYFNGKFHDELGVQFNATTLSIIGTTWYAKGIIAKYGEETFGLSEEKWEIIFDDRGALNELMNVLKTILYG